MLKKKKISFAIPCFNEELNVVNTFNALQKVRNENRKYDFEFIFADNGSIDNTRELIRNLAKKNKNVIGVFLTRNFGPEASSEAAMSKANGDAVVPYECDMQDPPELISDFIKKWEEGFDIVVGKRDKIEDGFFMIIARKMFYRIFKAISNIDVPVDAGSFGLLDKKVIIALRSLPEKHRFFRGLRSWVGFKTTYIHYQRRKRKYGKSSYSFFDYIKHSERGIFGFSYLLLDFIVYLGFILVTFSFLFIFGYIMFFILFGNPIKGSVTILVSIIFLGGVQLLAISTLGKYIQVIVDEVKQRPMYIIEEVVNG